MPVTRARRFGRLAIVGAVTYACLAQFGGNRSTAEAAQDTKPNILFIVLDDVGVDQMKLFGFGGTLAARMPNMAKIAELGVQFTNVWAMPECSPSRAAFFTGRYPLRTGVESAIVAPHLPQAHLSQYEATLPRVLAEAGYVSGITGKFHLGEDPDPAGSCAPARRGFDFFDGMSLPGPVLIDRTVGGGDPSGGQACGYFQDSRAGACYTVNKQGATRCTQIDMINADPATSPSRTCLQDGGLFRPGTACGESVPTADDFALGNAFYVWQRVQISGPQPPDWIDESGSACSPTTVRQHMDEVHSINGVDWWNKQVGPRMLTVSYGGMHTPFQKGPTNVLADPRDWRSSCRSLPAEPRMLRNILETLDVLTGRMLAGMGLGTLDADERTLASLDLGNTVIVILGDNGSFAGTVRVTEGFAFDRSKASVYQTGVWVPLIVAGPMVSAPGREVDELINVTDLFQLFGDIAGLDVNEIVPPSHLLDTKSMIPYLDPTTARTAELRTTNFTQAAVGALTPVPEDRSWPCLVAPQCIDTILYAKPLCEDNGGVWFGPGGDVPASSCCEVVAGNSALTILPTAQYATRTKQYKLVELHETNCAAPLAVGDAKAFPWQEYQLEIKREFYDLTATPSNPAGMDVAEADLLRDCPAGKDPETCLPAAIRPAYEQLSAVLGELKDSATAQRTCRSTGDGNGDLRVNRADIVQWRRYNGTGPSQYDINTDGQTDRDDLAIIRANLGTDCMSQCARADLNRDGEVDAKDMALLVKQKGTCDPVLCSGDLDGNGVVNNRDANLLNQARNSCTP